MASLVCFILLQKCQFCFLFKHTTNIRDDETKVFFNFQQALAACLVETHFQLNPTKAFINNVAHVDEFPGCFNGGVNLVLAFLNPLVVHKRLQLAGEIDNRFKKTYSPSCSEWNDNGFFPR